MDNDYIWLELNIQEIDYLLGCKRISLVRITDDHDDMGAQVKDSSHLVKEKCMIIRWIHMVFALQPHETIYFMDTNIIHFTWQYEVSRFSPTTTSPPCTPPTSQIYPSKPIANIDPQRLHAPWFVPLDCSISMATIQSQQTHFVTSCRPSCLPTISCAWYSRLPPLYLNPLHPPSISLRKSRTPELKISSTATPLPPFFKTPSLSFKLFFGLTYI